MWPPGTTDCVISKKTQRRDLNRKKKGDSLFEMYKSYIHTHTLAHKPTHTLSIVKVNGSIHTNILKAT